MLEKLFISLLTISIICGQLIKLPITAQSGITFLDLIVWLIALVGLYKSKLKFSFRKTPLFLKLLLTFLIVCFISLIFSPLHLNAQEFLISFSYLIRLTSFILLGILIANNIFPKIKKNVLLILICSGFGLAILGLLQLIFIPDLRFLAGQGWDPHYFRTASTLLDPNFLGAFLGLTLLLFTLEKVLFLNQRVKTFIFVLIYLALVTAFSRSAAILSLSSFAIIALFRKSLNLLKLTLLMLVGFGIGFLIYHQLVAAPRNINREQSAQFRLYSWQEGLQVFEHSPILGVGFNSYRFALKEYKLVNTQQLNSHGASFNDSSLLHILATTGLIGLVVYLLFIFSLMKFAYQSYLEKRPWGVIVFSGTVGLILQSFFINTLFYPWILVWFSLAASKLSAD